VNHISTGAFDDQTTSPIGWESVVSSQSDKLGVLAQVDALRVADQDAFHARSIGYGSKGGVVSGEHGDFLMLFAQLVQAW
jgi:hypothetical protein